MSETNMTLSYQPKEVTSGSGPTRPRSYTPYKREWRRPSPYPSSSSSQDSDPEKKNKKKEPKLTALQKKMAKGCQSMDGWVVVKQQPIPKSVRPVQFVKPFVPSPVKKEPKKEEEDSNEASERDERMHALSVSRMLYVCDASKNEDDVAAAVLELSVCYKDRRLTEAYRDRVDYIKSRYEVPLDFDSNPAYGCELKRVRHEHRVMVFFLRGLFPLKDSRAHLVPVFDETTQRTKFVQQMVPVLDEKTKKTKLVRSGELLLARFLDVISSFSNDSDTLSMADVSREWRRRLM